MEVRARVATSLIVAALLAVLGAAAVRREAGLRSDATGCGTGPWLNAFPPIRHETKSNPGGVCKRFTLFLRFSRLAWFVNGLDQRTRQGRLLSKVQPGIRYCMAAASSRAPRPCTL